MGNSFGRHLKLSIFGESHGAAIGIVMDGLPSGFQLDLAEIQREMTRRAPGRNQLSTARQEADAPEIVSGFFEGRTTGTPLCAIIYNQDNRSKDYGLMKEMMRPGHGDYPGHIRYSGFQDYRGGGHFSGRITAPLVFAGAVCKQILKEQGVVIGAHIKQISHVEDGFFTEDTLTEKTLCQLTKEELPLLKKELAPAMENAVLEKKKEGDSVGGIIECAVIGLPAGIGDPFFDSVESVLAQLMFSVPAVKGVEFGLGFQMAGMTGSQCNDAYRLSEEGKVTAKSNNNGGVLGGITNGMPVVLRTVIKPTPSISVEQDTVNIATGKEAKLVVPGRHDPCIIQRAVPVIEAAAAIGIYECVKRRLSDGIGL